MIAGEFDLSIGSLVAFAQVIIGIGVTTWGCPIWRRDPGVHGADHAPWRGQRPAGRPDGAPSFIVTLATLFIIKGLTIVMTASITNITYIPISRSSQPTRSLARSLEPVPGWGAGAQVSIVWWMPGRHRRVRLLADAVRQLDRRVGGLPPPPATSGSRWRASKIVLFAGTAFSASILAAIASMTVFSADVLRGAGSGVDAITTAVIGGTLLTGGYGSVVGTFVGGALALGMSEIGHLLRGRQRRLLQDRARQLLLIAVILNNWIRRRYAGLRKEARDGPPLTPQTELNETAQMRRRAPMAIAAVSRTRPHRD